AERPVEAPTMPNEPRAEAAVPVRRPGKGAKIFSAIMWALALFFTAAFIHVGFSGQYYTKPIDVLYFKLAGIVGVVTSLAMGLEAHKFARGQGRYDIVPQKPHQLGRMLIRRLLILTGIFLLATLAASIISTFIFSFLPQ
ncbi:MAG: hypothetical protein Q4B54_12325, partial [Coriobacteriales bacterium]|nr:hypothetical protein [Coriobacteriales bacterium]